MDLKELDAILIKLFSRHDKLKSEGWDRLRDGEYDRIMVEIKERTQERVDLNVQLKRG